MLVEITTTLDITPQRAWQEVQTTRLLNYIVSPLVTFEPVEPRVFPAVWQERKYLVSMKLFGWIPFGKHYINISTPVRSEAPGLQTYQIRDEGFGDVIKKWDHLITIREMTDGRTQYTDRVEVQAGVLTPFVWVFAIIFYRYRQRNWRKLVHTDFAYQS